MGIRKVNAFAITTVILLLIVGMFSTPASAAVVWSDDFSDGNYDGWTILEGTFDTPVSPKYSLTGSSTGFNMIYYPSVQVNGEWIFELYEQVTAEGSIEVLFVATGTTSLDFEGYSLYLTYNTVYLGLSLCRWNYSSSFDRSARWTLASFYIWEDPDPLPTLGWHLYNVTRDMDDEFIISRDEVEIVVSNPLVEDMDFDSRINTSDKFIVKAEEDASIDTIVVGTDLPPITTETTTDTTSSSTTNTTTTPTDPTIPNLGPGVVELGIVSAAIVLIVVVVIIQKKR